MYSYSRRAFPVMNYVLPLCADNVVDEFYIKIDDTTTPPPYIHAFNNNMIPMLSGVPRLNTKIVRANRGATVKRTSPVETIGSKVVRIT